MLKFLVLVTVFVGFSVCWYLGMLNVTLLLGVFLGWGTSILVSK